MAIDLPSPMPCTLPQENLSVCVVHTYICTIGWGYVDKRGREVQQRHERCQTTDRLSAGLLSSISVGNGEPTLHASSGHHCMDNLDKLREALDLAARGTLFSMATLDMATWFNLNCHRNRNYFFPQEASFEPVF